MQWEEEYLEELERLHWVAGWEWGQWTTYQPHPVGLPRQVTAPSFLRPASLCAAGPRGAGEYVMAENNPFLTDLDSFSKGKDLFKKVGAGGLLVKNAVAKNNPLLTDLDSFTKGKELFKKVGSKTTCVCTKIVANQNRGRVQPCAPGRGSYSEGTERSRTVVSRRCLEGKDRERFEGPSKGPCVACQRCGCFFGG